MDFPCVTRLLYFPSAWMMYSFPCSVGLEKSSGDWKHRELLSLSLSTSALFVLDSRVFPLTKRKLFPSSSLFSHARLFRSLVILFHAAYRMRPPTFLLELGSFYREGGRRESRRTILREIFISRTIRNDLWSWESSCVRDVDGETKRKQWMNEYNLFLREKSKRNIWFSLRRIHRIHEDKNIIILKMGP